MQFNTTRPPIPRRISYNAALAEYRITCAPTDTGAMATSHIVDPPVTCVATTSDSIPSVRVERMQYPAHHPYHRRRAVADLVDYLTNGSVEVHDDSI